MIPYILSAVGGYLIGDSIGKQYAKGGRVEYVANDPYDRILFGHQKYFRRFNDAIGSFAWIYNKKYNEGILYPLDSFDKEYYSHIQLKKDEVLLRYRTDRMVKDEKHLIKFNLDKALVYFMSDSDDDKNPKFETRGIKAEYIAISKDYAPKIMADGGKMAKGGKVETYAVHPQRKINVARPDGEQLYTTDYLSSFRVVGTLSEAEEQAQKFVRENEIMFPYVEIKRLHPSGNPLKSKKVSRVEKDKITKL